MVLDTHNRPLPFEPWYSQTKLFCLCQFPLLPAAQECLLKADAFLKVPGHIIGQKEGNALFSHQEVEEAGKIAFEILLLSCKQETLHSNSNWGPNISSPETHNVS